jgi:hypothetical protein
MSVKTTNISADTNLTFDTTPIVQTMTSTDNSTKCASTAFTQTNFPSSLLTTNFSTNTNQSVTGTKTLTATVTSIDSSTSTIQLGKLADTSASVGTSTITATSSISINGILQNLTYIYRYLLAGSSNITTTTGTAVKCQKLQAGVVFMDVSPKTVTFPDAFTNTPTVLLTQYDPTTGTTFSTANIVSRFVTSPTSTNFVANGTNAGVPITGIYLNWVAIGN